LKGLVSSPSHIKTDGQSVRHGL